MRLSFEVSPNQHHATVEVVNNHPQRDTIQQQITFFVPHIHGKPYQQVIEAVQALQRADLKVCPHFAVRNFLIEEQPIELLQQFTDIDELLLLGGDGSKPCHYESVLDFLKQISAQQLPVKTLNFAVFASEHPHVSELMKWQVLQEKVDWAEQHQFKTQLMTQIEFDTKVIVKFRRELARHSIDSPLCVGFVAPCRMDKLIKISNSVGIGNLLSFAMKTNLLKLISTYDGQEFIDAIAPEAAGLHCYSFGNAKDGLAQLLAHA